MAPQPTLTEQNPAAAAPANNDVHAEINDISQQIAKISSDVSQQKATNQTPMELMATLGKMKDVSEKLGMQADFEKLGGDLGALTSAEESRSSANPQAAAAQENAQKRAKALAVGAGAAAIAGGIAAYIVTRSKKALVKTIAIVGGTAGGGMAGGFVIGKSQQSAAKKDMAALQGAAANADMSGLATFGQMVEMADAYTAQLKTKAEQLVTGKTSEAPEVTGAPSTPAPSSGFPQNPSFTAKYSQGPATGHADRLANQPPANNQLGG